MDLSLNEFDKITIAKKVVNDLIAKKTVNGFDEKDEELKTLLNDKKLINMGNKEAIEKALNIYFFMQGE